MIGQKGRTDRITWNTKTNCQIDFKDISSVPPSPRLFFVLLNQPEQIKLGYFTGDIINRNKIIIEIVLNIDKSRKLLSGENLFYRTVLELTIISICIHYLKSYEH